MSNVTPMIIQAKVDDDTENLYAYVREGMLVEGQVFEFRGKQYTVQCLFGADESYGRNLVGFMAQCKTDKEVFEISNPGKKYEDHFPSTPSTDDDSID